MRGGVARDFGERSEVTFMSASVWEEFDPESFQDYLRAWNDPTLLAKLEITDNDAAYHVLAYSGLLARREADGRGLPTSFAQMPSQERVRLVRSACARMAGFSFDAYYHDLFARDQLDLDELAEANELLIQRDEWDAALWMACKLVDDQLESDEALLSDLALAHSVAAAFDEELFKHPDIVAGALYILDDAPENQRIGLWFQRAQEFDRQFNDPTLADVDAAAMRRHAGGESRRGRRLSDLLLLPNGDAGVAQAEDHYSLAATAGRSPSAIADEKQLLQREWRVADDALVTVRFRRDTDRRAATQWNLELIGPMDAKSRYVSAEVELSAGARRSAAFSLGAATFALEPADLPAEVSAVLVDVQGVRRRVLLGESRNGGR